MSARNLTLLGANLIFAGVSAALFFLPGWELVIYPAYTLIFFWADLRRDEEIHIIFVFLATIAGALVLTRSPDGPRQLGIGLEALAVWMLSFGLGFHRSRRVAEARAMLAKVEELDVQIRDHERELRFYGAYEQSTTAQVNLRRDMTQAAKSLGTTMDADEVQLRLMRIMEARFQGSRIQILPGQPEDPLVAWAVETRTPVLVKDMQKEDRFGGRSAGHPFRSAMVVPIPVMKKPYGFIRVESSQPQLYSNDDLRTVDLFATLASLALENIHLYEEVRSLATHDSLTQLFTQRALLQRLKEEILRAGRSQSPLAFIMADIDLFKQYNDTYGHQAGDELLRSVSRILVNHTRPVDCVARYGGEEFSVILPNTVRDHALEVANRMRLAVASEPFLFKGQRTRVTLSFGVAAFPQDATSQSQLIRVADERLYRSKANGRNQVS